MKRFVVAAFVVAALSLLLVAAVYAQVPDDTVLSGEQCKMCHAEQYEVWAGTAHPKSIDAVKSSDHASEDCLHCMSGDYRWDETLTVETFKYGVTCVACHAPHDTPGDDKPMIEDVAALCKDCHNAHLEEGVAEFEPGATARHPSKEMMAGLGAVGVASTPSKHDMDCNTCHLEGHKYEPAQSACDGCHGGDATIEAVAAQFAPRLEELGAIETLADEYPAAYTNVTMLTNDKSNGIHNFTYATAMLAAIDTVMAGPPAEPPAEEEAAPEEAPAEIPETGGAAPLVSGPTLLMLSGMLSLAGGVGAYVWGRRR
jgi:predicted CXXCH cytochrome family protein